MHVSLAVKVCVHVYAYVRHVYAYVHMHVCANMYI